MIYTKLHVLHYITLYIYIWASQVVLVVKNLSANAWDVRNPGSIPGSERSLEKGKATHSSILAWRIPSTEEPGGSQCIGLQRVGHNWSDLALIYVTHTSACELIPLTYIRYPCVKQIAGEKMLYNTGSPVRCSGKLLLYHGKLVPEKELEKKTHLMMVNNQSFNHQKVWLKCYL